MSDFTTMFSPDMLGYLALAINLFSMSVKGEKRLRTFSTIANGIYIVYGIYITAYPIIIGCSIAVMLHGFHLRRLYLNE